MVRMITSLINWTLRLVLNTGAWILRFALNWTLWILRVIVLPLVLRFIRFLLMLLLYTVVGTFTGPRRATDEVANDWTERVLGMGASHAFASNLFPIFKVGAYLLILVGWTLIIGINALVLIWWDKPVW